MPTNLFDLTGKVAIVTGASSGLGVVFAEALAEAGADLAICARRLQRLEETGRRIRSLGRRCLVVQTDVTSPEQVDNLTVKTLQKYGKIDILVNNAGMAAGGVAEKATLEEFNQVLRGNLINVFICSQRVGREMLARRYGRIINIASVTGPNGSIPVDLSASYAPAKNAVVGLTREFAVQWAKKGVTVNAIAPGYFPSELAFQALQDGTYNEEQIMAGIRERTPMGRTGELKELKGIVIFLASDASSYITGQTIFVDGGMSVW